MMLFFSAKDQIKIQQKKFRTSPVRSSKTSISWLSQSLKKRVSLPASLRIPAFRRRCCRTACASLSVEAALVLPLCLFSCVLLMMPVKLFEEQRKIQAALEEASRDLSQYAYVKQQLEQGNEAIGGNNGLASLVGLGYVRAKVMEHVEEGIISQVSFARSRILEEDEEILLVMDYRLKLPFSVFGLDSIPMESVSLRRAWVGAEGGRLEGGSSAGREEEEEVVYLGKNPTRYHVSPLCHYLYNDLQAVSAEQIEGLRNQQGQRYKPCKRCGNASARTYYIMPSGSSYHTSESCSAIGAYVRAVKRSEAEYLGACSYCGGG